MKEFRKLKSLKFLYEINRNGVLRNVKSKRIIKGYTESNGYVRVKLENKCLGGIVRTSIHQLVAEAFIPNPNNLPEVNHKDSERANNCADNLEWVTHAQNMRHAYHDGKNAKSVSKGLREHSGSTRKRVSNGSSVFCSISDAAKWLSSNGKALNTASGIAGISAVCRGKRKSFGGYSWKYV